MQLTAASTCGDEPVKSKCSVSPEPHHDAMQALGADAVAVHPGLAGPNTLGQAADAVAQLQLGEIERPPHHRAHRRRAALLE